MIFLDWNRIRALHKLTLNARGTGIEFLSADRIRMMDYHNQEMIVVWNPERQMYFREPALSDVDFVSGA